MKANKQCFEGLWKATKQVTDGKAGNSSTKAVSAWPFVTDVFPLFSKHLRKTQLSKLDELSELLS